MDQEKKEFKESLDDMFEELMRIAAETFPDPDHIEEIDWNDDDDE